MGESVTVDSPICMKGESVGNNIGKQEDRNI